VSTTTPTRASAIEGRYPPGAVLGARYEVRGRIGRGGMAEVYEAWDPGLRRRVAVKLLWDGLAKDPTSRERFRREAQAAAGLAHSNIVSVFDLGEDRGIPFIVMELVEGRGLDDVIWREAPLSIPRTLRIVRAVASALAHAHAAGIVHRDVKPGNVMLGPDGAVRVLDFGIARASAWTPLTQNQAVQGTAHYVAPEVVQGRPADARSDLYSLGCVWYELLCGRPPFTGESAMAIAYRHVQEEPVPIGQWNRDVPRDVEALVMRCLAKDPARRYQRAADLREDLRALARAGSDPAATPRSVGLSPSAATVPLSSSRTPSVPPPPRRDTPPLPPPASGAERPERRRRHPVRRAAVVALSLVILAAGLAALWSLRPAPAAGRAPEAPAPISEPLLAPTRMRTVAVCDGFLSSLVTLRWAPTTSPQADGYEVFRSTSASGPFRSVAFVIGRSTARYADSEVGSGTTYYYMLKSSGGGKTSAYSTSVRADTPGICLFP
jgi:eukaryotic-like serine/threonine-protein kinase